MKPDEHKLNNCLKILHQMKEREKDKLNGNCRSFSEYEYHCDMLKNINQLISTIYDLKNKTSLSALSSRTVNPPASDTFTDEYDPILQAIVLREMKCRITPNDLEKIHSTHEEAALQFLNSLNLKKPGNMPYEYYILNSINCINNHDIPKFCKKYILQDEIEKMKLTIQEFDQISESDLEAFCNACKNFISKYHLSKELLPSYIIPYPLHDTDETGYAKLHINDNNQCTYVQIPLNQIKWNKEIIRAITDRIKSYLQICYREMNDGYKRNDYVNEISVAAQELKKIYYCFRNENYEECSGTALLKIQEKLFMHPIENADNLPLIKNGYTLNQDSGEIGDYGDYNEQCSYVFNPEKEDWEEFHDYAHFWKSFLNIFSPIASNLFYLTGDFELLNMASAAKSTANAIVFD